MANLTIVNATTFTVAPVMSGANITASTLPYTAIGGGLDGTQTWSGVNTYTKTPLTSFTTDSSDSSIYYGYLSGSNITTGVRNTCWGPYSGRGITTGSDNTCFGGQVLGSTVLTIVTGSRNSALGQAAMTKLTSGSDNTAVGQLCFGASATLNIDSCTGIGRSAGASIVSGTGDTAVGQQALLTFTVANMNTGIGKNALISTASPVRCTSLGGNTATGQTQSTAIGISSVMDANNQMQMGTTAQFVNLPGTSANGSLRLAGPVFNNAAAPAVFEITESMPERGSAYKRVVLYCNNTSGDTVISFPTAFLQTPVVRVTNGLSTGIVTGLSTTGCTVTGAGNTGYLIIEGF